MGLSVEYLVTGREAKHSIDLSKYLQFRGVIDDLSVLPVDIVMPIKTMIKAAADFERKKSKVIV
ncbi:hypothetical protein FACS189483_09630 [Spirochaetia bacterium]|nr:hypothetical protein FACS189483_09630 [Spirochaetia bacterium]